ncbi:MAG: 16S rRNA (guanine(527)-N(7))-methyltransferase RsmG [Desulfuromonadales bacterium]
MDGSRLQRGLAALDLAVTPQQEERLMLCLRELLRWNEKVNLTSITDEDEAVEKHIIDSLTLLPHLGENSSLLDIGSGGGFPGLPLKIMRPDLEVVSVDAVQKKILFQRHVARLLNLETFTAVHGRIESLSEKESFRQGFSMVTSRALSDIETFLRWAKPFAGPRGRFVAMKGRDGEQELEKSREAMEREDIELLEIVRIHLPFSGSLRHLLFFTPA